MDDPPFTMPVIGNTVPPCLEHRKDFLFAMASFVCFMPKLSFPSFWCFPSLMCP